MTQWYAHLFGSSFCFLCGFIILYLAFKYYSTLFCSVSHLIIPKLLRDLITIADHLNANDSQI